MVTRRQVLTGCLGFVAGGGALAADRFRSGGNGQTMSTDGSGGGCRNGVLRRPRNDTFKFMNVLGSEAVELHISVEETARVDAMEISANGEVVHTATNISSGNQKIAFADENATEFEVRVLQNGSVIDDARFYSRCAGEPTDGTSAT